MSSLDDIIEYNQNFKELKDIIIVTIGCARMDHYHLHRMVTCNLTYGPRAAGDNGTKRVTQFLPKHRWALQIAEL